MHKHKWVPLPGETGIEIVKRTVGANSAKSVFLITEICESCDAGRTSDGVEFKDIRTKEIIEDEIVVTTGKLRYL